jgi:iron complex transport system substrate-binding protein
MRTATLLAFAATLAFASPGAVASSQAAPQRIVSLNLCADQYLIALADPGQIAALTSLSQDPEFSYFADKAAAFHAIQGLAEEVLRLDPDLLITNPWGASQTLALLRDFDIPTLHLDYVTSYEGILAETRLIAKAIGQEARGEALIRSMSATLEDAALARDGAPMPSAVPFQRRGFTTGSETLLDEALRRAGLRNFSAERGRIDVGRIGLEDIVSGRPDFLLLQEPISASEDLGTELLTHPVLTRLYPESRRLYLPQALIGCGGPSFPAAVDHLRAQLQDLGTSP